jgi:hypothetical protein
MGASLRLGVFAVLLREELLLPRVIMQLLKFDKLFLFNFPTRVIIEPCKYRPQFLLTALRVIIQKRKLIEVQETLVFGPHPSAPRVRTGCGRVSGMLMKNKSEMSMTPSMDVNVFTENNKQISP